MSPFLIIKRFDVINNMRHSFTPKRNIVPERVNGENFEIYKLSRKKVRDYKALIFKFWPKTIHLRGVYFIGFIKLIDDCC